MVCLIAAFLPMIFLVWRMLRRHGWQKWANAYAIVMCVLVILVLGGTIVSYLLDCK